jgi:hypothetical protein
VNVDLQLPRDAALRINQVDVGFGPRPRIEGDPLIQMMIDFALKSQTLEAQPQAHELMQC